MLSTETLEVIHFGADRKRSEKIEAIADWAMLFPLLKVCEGIPDGYQNCCRCPKCVRTMIGLELEGVLNQYQTFPLPLNRNRIRLLNWLTDEDHMGDANRHLRKALLIGRMDLAFDLRLSFAISRFISSLRLILPTKLMKFLFGLGNPEHRKA